MLINHQGIVKKGTIAGIYGKRSIQVLYDWPYYCTYDTFTGEFDIRFEGLYTFQLKFRPGHNANRDFFEEKITPIIGEIANDIDPYIMAKVRSCVYCRYY